MECVINHMLALLVEWRTNKESSGFMQHILYLCLVKHIFLLLVRLNFQVFESGRDVFLELSSTIGLCNSNQCMSTTNFTFWQICQFLNDYIYLLGLIMRARHHFHDYHRLEEFFIGRIFSPRSRISGVIHHWRWNQIRLFHQAFGCVKEFNKR